MPSVEALKNRIGRPFVSKERRLVLAALFLFLFLLASALIMLTQLPSDVIARGISIGPFDVGGLTNEQALKFLQTQTTVWEERGIDFISGDKIVNLPANVNALSGSELAYTIFKYNPEEAMESALALSQDGNEWQKFWKGCCFGNYSSCIFKRLLCFLSFKMCRRCIAIFLSKIRNHFFQNIIINSRCCSIV